MRVKVAAGTITGIIFAFSVGFLRGYTWGIEYALNNVNNLRHGAECIGEAGCEWVYHVGSPRAGEPITSSERVRFVVKPFSEVPWWLGNVSFLKNIEYDVAQPLPQNRFQEERD